MSREDNSGLWPDFSYKGDLGEFMAYLGYAKPNTRLFWLSTCPDHFIFEQFMEMLFLLPIADRLTFVKLHLNKITDGAQLAIILSELPPSSRVFLARANRAKIRNGVELGQVLSCLLIKDRFYFSMKSLGAICNFDEFMFVFRLLPEEKRFVFAKRLNRLIRDGFDLARTLELIPENERILFAEIYQIKIQTGLELGHLLHRLPENETKSRFIEAQEYKIQNEEDLLEVLCSVNEEKRLNLARNHQNKVRNGVGLASIVRCLPERDRLPFAELLRHKIETLAELDMLFSIPGLSELLPEQKNEFFIKCHARIHIFNQLKVGRQGAALFGDPVARHMASLGELDLNAFLFSAAADPEREADFEFFLKHPLCSDFSLNGRAQNLMMHIMQAPCLSLEQKTLRVSKLMAGSEQLRNIKAGRYWGFNLSSIRRIEPHFPTERLPQMEPPTWQIVGVDASHIQRFLQLTCWLKEHPVLREYQFYFSALEENHFFRSAALFETVLEALEHFVLCLDAYLMKQKPPVSEVEHGLQMRALATYLDACDQLSVCPEGAINALQSMARSLNPSESLRNVVDVVLDQATRLLIGLLQIEEGNEVHLSKDRLWPELGVDSNIHYDPYRLPLAPAYFQAMLYQAAAQLTPERMVIESLPHLETIPCWREEEVVFDARFFNALERDAEILRAVGLVSGKKEDPQECRIDVIQFISDLSRNEIEKLLEKYEAGDFNQRIRLTLSFDRIKLRYREALEQSGVLSLSAEAVAKIRECIWRLLVTANFSDPDDEEFWCRLLQAPNGLGWIKAVLESHSPAEWNEIKLQALLYCPRHFSNNLFRALISDPIYAGWMMGWEFKEGHFTFDSIQNQPLTRVRRRLLIDEVLRQKEWEEAFIQSGNLLFFMAELTRAYQHRPLLDGMREFIYAQGGFSRFDSALAVLVGMMNLGCDFQNGLAQGFLEYRCLQQKTLGLWNCYWRTRCCLKGAELKLDAPDLILSLKEPIHAQAALYIVGSGQALTIKIMHACAQGLIVQQDLTEILLSLKGLYPSCRMFAPALNIAPGLAGVETVKAEELDDGNAATPSAALKR